MSFLACSFYKNRQQARYVIDCTLLVPVENDGSHGMLLGDYRIPWDKMRGVTDPATGHSSPSLWKYQLDPDGSLKSYNCLLYLFWLLLAFHQSMTANTSILKWSRRPLTDVYLADFKRVAEH